MRYSIEQVLEKVLKSNKEVSNFSIYSDEMTFTNEKKEYCFEISDEKTSASIDLLVPRRSVLNHFISKRVKGGYLNLIPKEEIVVDSKIIKSMNISFILGLILDAIGVYLLFSINEPFTSVVFIVLSIVYLYFDYRARNLLKYIKISK